MHVGLLIANRVANCSEIRDFIKLCTCIPWRQAIVVIPPFSPERETFCMLSFALTYSLLLSPDVRWSPHSQPGGQLYGNQRFHKVMHLHSITVSHCRHSWKEFRYMIFLWSAFAFFSHQLIFCLKGNRKVHSLMSEVTPSGLRVWLSRVIRPSSSILNS